MTRLTLISDTFETPTGEMRAVTDENGVLRALEWTNLDNRLHRLLSRHYGADGYRLVGCAGDPTPARLAMTRYFGGALDAVDALETRTGGTAFQKEVWAALRTIPCGQTLSYGGLADRIGRPRAVRAVGLANGANPVGIVVPCHRVVGSDGRLHGFTAPGGLTLKQRLLDLEA